MGGGDGCRRGALRDGRERRGLLRAAGRGLVPAPWRAAGADDGDVAPVPAHRGDPGDRGVERRRGAQAAAAARRRQLVVPAPGEDRAQPRALRARLPQRLDARGRSDAAGFLVPALPRRPGAARGPHRGRDGAGAGAGRGRDLQGDQRAHPLRAGRPPADRADAGGARRLRGLRLHLRDRPGRRRGQGPGGMGDRGRDRVGHVVLRPAALHRVLRPGLLRRQGGRGLRARIRHALSAPRLAGGKGPADLGAARATARGGRGDRALQRLGAGGLVRAGRRRRVGGGDADLVAAPGPGSRASARSAWRCATPPA